MEAPTKRGQSEVDMDNEDPISTHLDEIACEMATERLQGKDASKTRFVYYGAHGLFFLVTSAILLANPFPLLGVGFFAIAPPEWIMRGFVWMSSLGVGHLSIRQLRQKHRFERYYREARRMLCDLGNYEYIKAVIPKVRSRIEVRFKEATNRHNALVEAIEKEDKKLSDERERVKQIRERAKRAEIEKAIRAERERLSKRKSEIRAVQKHADVEKAKALSIIEELLIRAQIHHSQQTVRVEQARALLSDLERITEETHELIGRIDIPLAEGPFLIGDTDLKIANPGEIHEEEILALPPAREEEEKAK